MQILWSFSKRSYRAILSNALDKYNKMAPFGYYCQQQLLLAWTFLSETMLCVEQDLVLVQVFHYLARINMCSVTLEQIDVRDTGL